MSISAFRLITSLLGYWELKRARLRIEGKGGQGEEEKVRGDESNERDEKWERRRRKQVRKERKRKQGEKERGNTYDEGMKSEKGDGIRKKRERERERESELELNLTSLIEFFGLFFPLN